MAKLEGKPSNPSGRSAERRAYQRHPIYLPAEIVVDGVANQRCVIRDYCLGGMLLVLNQADGETRPSVDIRLAANDLIVIQCVIEIEGAKNRVRFKARIARTDASVAGVSFINPDLNALQLVRQYAREHPADAYEQDASSDKSAVKTGDTPVQQNVEDRIQNAAAIVNGCNRIALQGASRLMDEFHDVVSDNLFETAKDCNDLSLQNIYFQTVNILNSQFVKLRQDYLDDVKQRLISGQPVENPDDDQTGEFSADSLQLVEDHAFDKWLAISTMVNRVESELGEILLHLEKRLSKLFGFQIDKKNNPYGPGLFAVALQNALEPLGLEHDALIKCHQIYSQVLFEQSETLYTKLNDFLIGQGVLPVIKRRIAKAKREKPQPDQSKAEQQDSKAEQSNQQDAVKKEIKPITEKLDGQKADLPVLPAQDLYSLVGELRSLQQQLKAQSTQQTATTGTPLPGSHPDAQAGSLVQLPAYSKPELLEALSNIKFVRHDGNAPGTAENNGIASQLLEALRAKHGNETDKIIGKEENYVIDVAENVFTSLLSDQTVANSVRPWIEKLGVPVVKMALLDKSLFVDKSHIVRQVINKLADLEILAEAEDDEDQQAIKRAFSWVVDLINNQFDGTTKVFSRAMQQLDMLNRIQNQSYEKNLKLVINDFMQEERQQAEDGAEPAASSDDELKQDEWLRRVHRLKEGQWVLFEAHSEEPKRLKVAWIAERSGKYVFVNVMGRKDRVLMDKQLADLFRTADAVVLDGVDEPVMDRAQYTMLQNLHKQLLYQASHDEMTGLINRREFEKCIKEAIADAYQNQTRHAICQFDIDKFTVINSSYGYEAGDILLKQIVALVDESVKNPHVLSRIGDDEFGLVLQEQALDDAMEIIEDIMIALEEFRFVWNNERIPVSISAGLAMINGQSKDVTSVLQSAESSCNLAKEMGGNRIQLFHSGSSKLAQRKEEMLWSTRVDKALAENSLYLRCQKISPLQSGQQGQDHYEILLGIPDELGGQASLPEFILAAEQYNRILDIDRWVIRSAFDWLAEHEHMLSDISGFSINLSGHSLNDDSLIDYIYQVAKDTAAPVELITFEITETAGISNLSDAADFITTVKGTGCRFSLDDFGAGMSSYAYLKSLPVDFLKIDGAFVKNIVHNPSDYAIVKSICEIAHFMEKAVIAEYVKDEETLKMVQQIGVDYAQGYGVEKPHLLDNLVK